MKTVPNIANNETIYHTGTLIVEGDVGEGAKLTINDGSLIIHGNVKKGVTIQHHVAAPKKTDFMSTIFNNINLNSNLTINCGAFIMEDGFSVQANITVGDDIFIGCVKINNRIFTNDQVTRLSANKFKITPDPKTFGSDFTINRTDSSIPPATPGIATAKIDGKIYKSTEIIVDNYVVTCADEPKNVVTSSELNEIDNAKFSIDGNIEEKSEVTSDLFIEVKGNIHSACTIVSKHGGLSAKNIQSDTRITTAEKISVNEIDDDCIIVTKDELHAATIKNKVNIQAQRNIVVTNTIGNECKLVSKQCGIEANNIGYVVQLESRDAIKVGNVGAGSTLTSKSYGITTKNIADSVTLTAIDAIEANDIGSDCMVSCQSWGISADTVGARTHLTALDAIKTESIGNDCVLISKNSEITSKEIGSRSQLTARNAISATQVDTYCKLTSKNNKISITGNVGAFSELESRDNIRIKNVGVSAKLHSLNGSITTDNLSENVSVTARDDIENNGTYYANTRFRSTNGTVTKGNLANIQEEKPLNQLGLFAQNPKDNFIQLCSSTVKTYLRGFNGETMADKINKLNLTKVEEELFTEFLDPLTEDYIKIPLLLNERYFDFDTLLDLKNNDKDKQTIDPFNREPYNPLELQSGRLLVNKLDDVINKLKQARSDAEIIRAPGGFKV